MQNKLNFGQNFRQNLGNWYIFGSLFRKIWFRFGSTFGTSAARPYPNKNRPPGAITVQTLMKLTVPYRNAKFIAQGNHLSSVLVQDELQKVWNADNIQTNTKKELEFCVSLVSCSLYSTNMNCGPLSINSLHG